MLWLTSGDAIVCQGVFGGQMVLCAECPFLGSGKGESMSLKQEMQLPSFFAHLRSLCLVLKQGLTVFGSSCSLARNKLTNLFHTKGPCAGQRLSWPCQDAAVPSPRSHQPCFCSAPHSSEVGEGSGSRPAPAASGGSTF